MRGAAVVLLVLSSFSAAASAGSDAPYFHPAMVLLDEEGRNVIETGEPVSAMRTCGECHDTRFIEMESGHADAGSGVLFDAAPGMGSPRASGRELYGGWNPITYRMLSTAGDEPIDLSLPDWIRFFGRRHVGGGPAFRERDGSLLSERASAGPEDAQASWLDPKTNRREPWDWRASGAVEMDCFLCHIPNPDNGARVKTIEKGAFRWASTATLARTGLTLSTERGWSWNGEAFGRDGRVDGTHLRVQDPTSENCAQCHGLVHGDPDMPVLLRGCVPEYWNTLTTGQIISPQKISDSGINLREKEKLARSWDVHAERLVDCVDCHHSLNNPIYRAGSDLSRPTHLLFDARRMSMGEYLRRPSHRLAFASGAGAETGSPFAAGCASCHRPEATHDWLPYWRRHLDALACNACHVPRLYAPARQTVDWTVLTPEKKPRTTCRGAESGAAHAESLIDGYEPVLLSRADAEGNHKLYPHNIVSSWFWVAGNPEKPVSVAKLEEAYFDEGGYRKDVVEALDMDGDGLLREDELFLDTPAKIEEIRRRLVASGLSDPRIVAEADPYPVSHGTTTAEWATRECRSCHGKASRLSRDFELAARAPGEVLPEIVAAAGVRPSASVVRGPGGGALLLPRTREAGLYVLGHDRARSAGLVGLFGVGAVVLGVGAHGWFRWRASRRVPRSVPGPCVAMERVYMYTAYERLWHWLQALAVLLLLATGIAIHFPDRAPLLPFALAVRLHNIIGFIVVVNAALAAFYHMASGEIRQYLPDRGNFFFQAIVQARYYMGGFFRGEPHPFEKRPGRKLNPLQQATYLAILNLLLPLQTITGILIWGAQRWPEVDARLGGLSILAPAHAAGAWLFAAFLLLHVYLTTTGTTPTANIRAMIVGWEVSEKSRNRKEASR